jgi:hypothetical protein
MQVALTPLAVKRLQKELKEPLPIGLGLGPTDDLAGMP